MAVLEWHFEGSAGRVLRALAVARNDEDSVLVAETLSLAHPRHLHLDLCGLPAIAPRCCRDRLRLPADPVAADSATAAGE